MFWPMLPLQAEQDLVRSRSATLPPLQSVVELTSAAAPPSRNAEEMAAVSTAGQQLLGTTRVLQMSCSRLALQLVASFRCL